MSHKIKIYIISMGLFLLGAMQLSVVVPSVLAADARGGPSTPTNVQDIDCPSGHANADNTGCKPLGNDCKSTDTGDECIAKNPIISYINAIIDFLSALVGVVVVGVIIVGGIQYSIAGDNSTAIQAARKRITNGLIALFVFLFISAFLQWIIPGGVL